MGSAKSKFYDVMHITDCHDTNDEGGQLAANKVRMAYRIGAARNGLELGQVDINGVIKFNTIDLGYKAADLYFTYEHLIHGQECGHQQIFVLNAAPPKQNNGVPNNERDLFVVGRLKNGAPFGGTQKGYALSYLKHDIAEMHELLDSNNGSQFRSLEVLPEAVMQFAAGTINPARIEKIDHMATVPDVPNAAHAVAIDNFGNVKICMPPETRNSLTQAFEAHAAGSHEAAREIGLAFALKSLEFEPDGADMWPVRALLKSKMFAGDVGTNVLAMSSSSRLRDSDGVIRPVAQLATICSRPDDEPAFEKPMIGARVRFNLG